MKPLFINAPSPTARFATCAVLSFLFVSIDHSNDHLSAIRAALSVLVYPVQYVVNAPVQLGADVAGRLRTRTRLIAENEKLRADNLRLSSKAQRFEALEQENARLRELLDSSSSFQHQVLVADVLAIETTPSSRQIVLNKGASEGVFVGQPMLDANGVIGQVSHVGPFSSTGLLITDPRHALPVRVNRSGLRAIAIGGGDRDQLSLSFVSGNADIKVGDLVVTSGLGGRFPSGYPVGRVADVSLDPGATFATILIDPSARVGHTREVLLVGPPPTGLEDERVSAVATQ